jgi:uncharacterized protein YjiS (DUF1127 family)
MLARTATLTLPAHLPPLSRALVALAMVVARWDHRRRGRHALARLDAHILTDIGLTPDRARDEVEKPFWRD